MSMSENVLSEEMKLEIGRMLREGVSDAGIQAVVESWKAARFPQYATFVEYGKPPTKEPANTVEGSIVPMKCNHCDVKDETVHLYREMDGQGKPTGRTDLMCDACFFSGESFPGDSLMFIERSKSHWNVEPIADPARLLEEAE